MECWMVMGTHAARPFGLVDVQDRRGRQIPSFAVVLLHPVENRRAPGIEADTVDGVLRSELIPDAVGLDQLDPRFAVGIAGLVDEILAGDVHAPADQRLAFLEREASRHLAAGRPQCEVGLGGAVPFRFG